MPRVVVVPHRPQWAGMYEREAVHLARALGSNAVAIHHIGSTAIRRKQVERRAVRWLTTSS